MKNKFIPLWYDIVFNDIFNDNQNIDLVEHLIALLFKRNIKDIQGKAKLLSRNLPKSKIQNANQQVDILVDVNGEKFNIEIESLYEETKLKKDYTYACNIHSRQVSYGIKDYSKIKPTNQVIIFMKGLKQKEVLTRYPFKSKNSEEILDSSMRIYLFDVENGLCYNEDTDEIIRFCHLLMAETKEEFQRLVRGVFKDMESENKLAKRKLAISMDPDDYSMSFELSEAEILKNTYINQGIEKGESIGLEKGKSIGLKKGKSIGLKQGQTLKQEEIARAMILDNIDKETIAKYTKLPISKIASL